MRRFAYPIIFIALIFFQSEISAQYPSKVKTFDAEPNTITYLSGNLLQGEPMSSLRWASRSSTACFPGTQNDKFNGNHVLFATKIPPHSTMFIDLIPDNKNANMSIYAYQTGSNNYSIPPGLTSCLSCEAEHKWDYPKRGKTQDHTRSVELNAINNGYNVVIGIAGADGLSSGSFKVKVNLMSKNVDNSMQKPLKVYRAASQKGATKAYRGNLKDGVYIPNLSWADNSSVACFPGTQNKKFTGKHVHFVTDIPPHSIMEIELIPTDKSKNMSLYAYQTGTSSKTYPPELSSCVTCEADYKWDYPKRGKTQNHTRKVKLNAINNPYRVVIGVAGANKLSEGEFIIRIKIE